MTMTIKIFDNQKHQRLTNQNEDNHTVTHSKRIFSVSSNNKKSASKLSAKQKEIHNKIAYTMEVHFFTDTSSTISDNATNQRVETTHLDSAILNEKANKIEKINTENLKDALSQLSQHISSINLNTTTDPNHIAKTKQNMKCIAVLLDHLKFYTAKKLNKNANNKLSNKLQRNIIDMYNQNTFDSKLIAKIYRRLFKKSCKYLHNINLINKLSTLKQLLAIVRSKFHKNYFKSISYALSPTKKSNDTDKLIDTKQNIAHMKTKNNIVNGEAKEFEINEINEIMKTITTSSKLSDIYAAYKLIQADKKNYTGTSSNLEQKVDAAIAHLLLIIKFINLKDNVENTLSNSIDTLAKNKINCIKETISKEIDYDIPSMMIEIDNYLTQLSGNGSNL